MKTHLLSLFTVYLALFMSATRVNAQIAYITNELQNTVTVMDLTSIPMVVGTISTAASPAHPVLNHAGTRAYIQAFTANKVVVINTATDVVLTTIDVGTNPVYMAISDDDSRGYVTCQGSQNVYVLDLNTNSVITTVNVGNYPTGVALSATGAELYVANGFDYSVSVINTALNIVTDVITVPGSPVDIKTIGLNSSAYVTLQAGTGDVAVFDQFNHMVTNVIDVGYQPHDLLHDPVNSVMFVANQMDDNLFAIDLFTNLVIDTLTTGDRPLYMALAPQNDRLFAVNVTGNSISEFSLPSHTPTQTIPFISDPSGMVVFNRPPSDLGIEESIGAEISVYPNPSEGTFTVNFPFQNSTMIIRDLNGRTVHEELFNTPVNKTFILNIEQGNYIISVYHDHTVAHLKTSIIR